MFPRASIGNPFLEAVSFGFLKEGSSRPILCFAAGRAGTGTDVSRPHEGRDRGSADAGRDERPIAAALAGTRVRGFERRSRLKPSLNGFTDAVARSGWAFGPSASQQAVRAYSRPVEAWSALIGACLATDGGCWTFPVLYRLRSPAGSPPGSSPSCASSPTRSPRRACAGSADPALLHDSDCYT